MHYIGIYSLKDGKMISITCSYWVISVFSHSACFGNGWKSEYHTDKRRTFMVNSDSGPSCCEALLPITKSVLFIASKTVLLGNSMKYVL